MRTVYDSSKAPPPLLTAVDATSQVHLIIGSNSLAAARCYKSIEVGAKPIVIAPQDAELHYTLAKKVEDGVVQRIQRQFEDNDLKTLGREEVDHVVDAVFITTKQSSSSRSWISYARLLRKLIFSCRYTHLHSLQATTNSYQCDRRSEPVHIFPSIYPFRRPFTNWYHHVW